MTEKNRLAIKNNEISVVINAKRELTIQEIIAAHQIVTGNFEALFVEENKSFSKEEKTKEAEKKWFEKGEKVKVNMMCAVCGLAEEVSGHYGNTYTKCVSCGVKLYNQPATEKGFGYLDERGNFYQANSVFNSSDYDEDFIEEE